MAFWMAAVLRVLPSGTAPKSVIGKSLPAGSSLGSGKSSGAGTGGMSAAKAAEAQRTSRAERLAWRMENSFGVRMFKKQRKSYRPITATFVPQAGSSSGSVVLPSANVAPVHGSIFPVVVSHNCA